MSTPEGRDYGAAGDKALVPGTLRAFRHFLLDTDTGKLMPMAWRPESMRVFGRREMPAYEPPGWGDSDGVHEAKCVRYDPFGALLNSIRAATQPEENHAVPSVNCSCGFYAHYDPATDFYPGMRWGRTYSRLSDQPEMAHLIIVRGVVEVSGTVVMGRLGVRAGKVRIVALAVDWEKQLKPTSRDIYHLRMQRRYNDLALRGQTPVMLWSTSPDGFSALDLDRYDYDPWDVTEEIEKEGEWAEGQVQAAAMRYRLDYFEHVGDMYERYPKEDVSHLVDTTQPRPLTEDELLHSLGVGTSYAQARQQANLYAQTMKQQFRQFGKAVAQANTGLQEAAKALQGSVKGVRADFVIFDEVVTTETVKEKALRLKKERPAPPGSGIDRRRGRLR